MHRKRSISKRDHVIVALIAALAAATAWAGDGEFGADRWTLVNAGVEQHLGRTALSGVAVLEDVEFENGVIEVDLAVDGKRSYPGIIFRMATEGEYERVYVRPHRAGLYPDAVQYTPVFNGVACWQLYHGDGSTAPAMIPRESWVTLKIEVLGSQARVFLGDAEEPALTIHDLKHGRSKGSIGLMGPRDNTAWFSNFRYRATDALEFDEPPAIETPKGMLTAWQVSRPFPADRIDKSTYPNFFTIFNAEWKPASAEPSGLVNLSRAVAAPGPSPQCVFAKTVVNSERVRDIELSLGYSDDVTVFLNSRPVFTGTSGYRSRDRSFLGIVGLHDKVYLRLEKGLNEILLIVTESFGGSGFMCSTNRTLDAPVKRHELLTKVWETEPVFRIPESVLFDPERNVLYVTSFDRVEASHAGQGFISRVKTDGEIQDLKWITGLDGPCGMTIHEDKLYVLEGFAGNLVEIDLDEARVVARYPVSGHRFLNDVAFDETGTAYISNTSDVPGARDIFTFKDSQFNVWKKGFDLHRANVLFAHDGALLVGNSGDGLLKRVDLASGHVTPIACLGAGVIDGIRVDSNGNYLVSHWEGQVYRITPSGDVVELLDTMDARLNSADFEYIADESLLIIPTFLGNRVTAYRVES